MTRIVSSTRFRLVGLALLAVASLTGQSRDVSASESAHCEIKPLMACVKCYGQYVDGQICDVLECVAGPTIVSNCR